MNWALRSFLEARDEANRINEVSGVLLAAGLKHLVAHRCAHAFAPEHGCPALRRLDLAWMEARRGRESMLLEVLFAWLRYVAEEAASVEAGESAHG